MPIDSAEKRRAAAGVSRRLPGVTPNAAKDAEWRREAGRGYIGLTLGGLVLVLGAVSIAILTVPPFAVPFLASIVVVVAGPIIRLGSITIRPDPVTLVIGSVIEEVIEWGEWVKDQLVGIWSKIVRKRRIIIRNPIIDIHVVGGPPLVKVVSPGGGTIRITPPQISVVVSRDNPDVLIQSPTILRLTPIPISAVFSASSVGVLIRTPTYVTPNAATVVVGVVAPNVIITSATVVRVTPVVPASIRVGRRVPTVLITPFKVSPFPAELAIAVRAPNVLIGSGTIIRVTPAIPVSVRVSRNGPSVLISSISHWSNPATWPGGVIPTRSMIAVIPDNMSVLVDTPNAVYKRLVVRGDLIFPTDRSGVCTGGSVILEGGQLWMGQKGNTIPQGFEAVIRFVANEATVVGGAIDHDNMPDPADPGATIYDTDVGLWAMHNMANMRRARWYAAGKPMDAWTWLVTTAAAGTSTIDVVQDFIDGWTVGLYLALGMTRFKTGTASESEVRQITGIQLNTPSAGIARITLNSPLTYPHQAYSPQWNHKGVTITEKLRGKVGLLGHRNVRFEAWDEVNGRLSETNRPHIILLGDTFRDTRDMAILNFGPLFKAGVEPWGRYFDHRHHQGNGSAGSIAKRIVYTGVKATSGVDAYQPSTQPFNIAVSNHHSHGIYDEDLFMFNVGRHALSGGQGPATYFLEEDAVLGTEGASDRSRFVRLLTMKTGVAASSNQLNGAFWFGLVSRTTGALACTGCDYDGKGTDAILFWQQISDSTADPAFISEKVRSFKGEAHSSRGLGFHIRNNPQFAFLHDLIDHVVWRNNAGGELHGAYRSHWWQHWFRAIGNKQIQFAHTTVFRGVTDFLADGRDLDAGSPVALAGTSGVAVSRYVAETSDLVTTGHSDSIYEDGVFQYLADFDIHHNKITNNAGAMSHVQFARVVFANTIAKIRYSDPAFVPDPADVLSDQIFPPGWGPSRQHDTEPLWRAPGSVIHVVAQSGLTALPANVDLYHSGDLYNGPLLGGTALTTANANLSGPVKRILSPTNTISTGPAHYRKTTPRVRIVTPVDWTRWPAADGQGRRLITLLVEFDSDIAEVYEFSNQYQILESTGEPTEFATLVNPSPGNLVQMPVTFDMADSAKLPEETGYAGFFVLAERTTGTNAGARSYSLVTMVFKDLAFR